MSDTCETCRFWKKNDVDNHPNTGMCRRFPPITVSCDAGCDPWPWTDYKDWCGEFEPVTPTHEEK